jgi:Mig-14 protein
VNGLSAAATLSATMHRTRISIDQYAQLCAQSDVSPNYHPRFIEYYGSRLKLRPKLIGIEQGGRLVAGFPTLFGQVFPTPLHKHMLGSRFHRIGEIGQPETLFPVLDGAPLIGLNRLSLTTSALLANRVRAARWRSLRSMAIAIERRHKKLTIRQRDFFATGGTAHFTTELDAKDFADVYVRLHSLRWGYPIETLGGVRDQIIALYDHVFGLVLEYGNEPVAAQLCYKAVGHSMYCVDFINSGVKLQKDNTISHGSVMMLTSLRRAEEDARAAGKRLRYSFGYYYGDNTYKAVWAQPEPTFVGY